MSAENRPFTIQAYSKKELKIMYGRSWKTFSAWLKPFLAEIGPYNGKSFTPKQVTIILDKIGYPPNYS